MQPVFSSDDAIWSDAYWNAALSALSKSVFTHLQDVLDTLLAENPIERIRIFSGIPRFYYGSRDLV